MPLVQGKGAQFAGIALKSILDQEIRNGSQLTKDELAQWPKGKKLPSTVDLEGMCEEKIAGEQGIIKLYYHLLLDLGYFPKIVLVGDKSLWLFQEDFLNLWQLSNLLFVLDEPGQSRVFVDPSLRFAPPGVINPGYQGTRGVMMHPTLGWTAQVIELPIEPQINNVKEFDYIIVPGEDDQFKLTTKFLGYPELIERGQFYSSQPLEQNRLLKERFEKGTRGISIQTAEVLNATNPKAACFWKVEGFQDRSGERQRLVQPFPGMPLPLPVPDSFPKERKLPIVMRYLQVQKAKSQIRVPDGYRALQLDKMVRKNRFGQVKWSMKMEPIEDGKTLEVLLEIQIESMLEEATACQELKDFLSWISESCQRKIIFEKI